MPHTLTLTKTQRRVLGVLVEKSTTTPDQYPLTVNALVAGSNQKSNRHPVASLTEGDVINAIQELLHQKLITQCDPLPGARVNRFQHTITARFPWSPKELAVLTELMLRGPQTVGELRTRCDRMTHMPDLATVQNLLNALAANDPPEIVVLPKNPGRSAIRYRHNFHPEDEPLDEPTQTPSQVRSPDHVPEPLAPSSVPPASTATALSQPDPEILHRLDALEQRINQLEDQMRSITG
jgi:uncharacterized protein